MRKRIKQIIEYPIVVIFAAACLGMLAGYIVLPQHEFSDMENRYLQLRPKMTVSSLADGSFMDSFETYSNEQIPGRSFLVKCKAAFVYLTGSSENDGIAKGEQDYLFDKVTAVNDRMQMNISSIKNFCAATDRDVYIAIAPTSTWINAEKLPKGMPVLDETSCSDDLTLALKDVPNAHIIDLYDKLYSHRDEHLYYRTDHHWTTRGAGYAYEKIADEMGLSWQDITRYERHEAGDFRGTHYAKYKGIGVLPDTIEYYDVPIDELALEKQTVSSLYDTEKLAGYDKYAMFMYGNDPKYEVRADKGCGRNLIVLKDSYANCLIPYLVMNYDSITVMDLRYFGGKVSEELAAKPDADVLLMYNWTFVNDDNHFYKLVDK